MSVVARDARLPAGGVEPGGLRDQVVDVAAAAQPGNDPQVAHHRAVVIAVGEDHAGQPAVGGRVGQPPPLPLTWHGPVDVHVLAGLAVRAQHGDLAPGDDVQAARRDLAEQVPEHVVVRFGPEGQAAAGRGQARIRSPLEADPLELAGEPGAGGRVTPPCEGAHQVRVGPPAGRQGDLIAGRDPPARRAQRVLPGRDQVRGQGRAAGDGLAGVHAVQCEGVGGVAEPPPDRAGQDAPAVLGDPGPLRAGTGGGPARRGSGPPGPGRPAR